MLLLYRNEIRKGEVPARQRFDYIQRVQVFQRKVQVRVGLHEEADLQSQTEAGQVWKHCKVGK